jgi:hypothetical protein
MTDFSNFGDIQLRDLAARHGTFFNPVASDADGGRNILVDFKGKDSAQNKHQLVTIKVSHDGNETDTKGKYVLGVNNGTDSDGSLTSVMTLTSGQVSIHTSTTVSGSLTASSGLIATAGGLTVSAGGANITGASTFEDTVTINGTGTALDVANGNVNIGGTLTVGSFEAASYTGLDLDDVADSDTRFAMTHGTQTFNGTKYFYHMRSDAGFTLGASKVHFWDAANTNRLWFHEDLKTKVRSTFSFVDVSEDANPPTYDSSQSILMAKTAAPWVQTTLTTDQAGTTNVVLGRFEFSGQHSSVYRTGAKIHAVTSSTQWDGSDTTIAPTELQFYTQSATALTDALTSPVVVIDSAGDLNASNNLNVTNQILANKATGYSLVTASNAKVNGYVEMTGINVLSGGTNTIAGNVSMPSGELTINNAGFVGLDVTGFSNFHSNVSVSAGMSCSGHAQFTRPSSNGITVTADAGIGGALNVGGQADVGGVLNLNLASGTGLNVVADASVGGDLSVTGVLGVTGDLTGVNMTASGVLTASGPNTAFVVTNNASVGGTLSVTGATNVGALTGSSTATFPGLVSCTAPSGTGLAVTKNATVGGTLSVTGVSTLTGAVSTSSTLTSAGVITCNESVNNVGIRNEGICEFVGEVKCLEASGTALNVSGSATVGKLLTLSRVTGAEYALDSFGNAKFRDDVEVLENLHITGTSNFTGDVLGTVGTFSGVLTANKASGTGLSVTNNAVVGGTLSAGATTLASGSVTGAMGVGGLLTASLSGQLALSVAGNATVGGSLTTTGATTFNGATNMNSASITNSLVINQASGTGLDVVDANARIGGNLTVVGDMIVSGTTTTVNTQTLTVSDNIIVVNETPLSSKDSGIVMARYEADIVADAAKESGTLDAGGVSVATLPSSVVGVIDGHYAGWYIKITNDSPVGALDQVRRISSYTASSREIGVDVDWSVQPDATSTFNIYNRPFVGLTYDESADEFVLAATALDPVDTINIQEYLNLHVNNIVTSGATTLGGDLVVGDFSISQQVGGIELSSSGPMIKILKQGNLLQTIANAGTTFGGNVTLTDGTITAHASGGANALEVTSGASHLLDASVTGTLSVTGGGSFSDGVTFDGVGDGISCSTNIAATSLSATSTLSISGTGDLDCDGPAHFSQPVTLTSALNGASASLSTTLGVTGVATFTAQSVHTNGIDASGSSDIETLVVSGAGTALSVTNNMSAGQVTVGSSGLVVNGAVDVNAVSDFSNTLTCSKPTGTGLVVSAGSNLQGAVTAGGDVGISGKLTGVTATFSGTVTADGVGGLSVTNSLSAGDISTTGTLTVTAAGDLDCDGAADFGSTLSVTGLLSGSAASLGTTLDVAGVATFTAQSVHNGGIDVNAASDILSLTVSGTGTGLSVDHNAIVGGTLSVTGASSYTGVATFSGGIDVDAASDISALTISGAGTSLTVNNTASVGALSVGGASSLTGLLTATGGFDANAASTVTKLTVDGTDTTSLIVDQGVSIGGALDVTGSATFTATSVHNGGLSGTYATMSGAFTSTQASGYGLSLDADARVNGQVSVGPGGTFTPVAGLNVGDEVPTITFHHEGSEGTVLTGDLFGEIVAFGRDASRWRKGASIRFEAPKAWLNADPNHFKAPSQIALYCQSDSDVDDFSAVLTASFDQIKVSRDMQVQSPTTFDSTVLVSGVLTASDAVNVSGVMSLTAAGTALSVTNDVSVGGTLGVTGDSTLTGAVTASSTVDVADTLSVTKADGTGLSVTADATVGGTLTVTGDLVVSGTTTTIDTATLAVEDHNIELGAVEVPTDVTADGGGLTLKGATDKTIMYDNTNTSWDMSENVNVASGKEYRINDTTKLDSTTVYLGDAAGDGVVYLGDDVDGSWKIDVDGSGDLRFSKKVGGSWVTKQTIS